VLASLAAYLLAGVAWSILKWYFYVLDEADKYVEAKRLDTINWSVVKHRYPPQVRDHKERIVRWMMCWVTSVIWTLCHDFLTRLYRRIVDMLAGLFQRISDRVFAKFDDFK
jgi:hypothetical protein